MINPEKFVRKHILDMPAYEPILPFEILSEELGIPSTQLVKLDANENPYGTLPQVNAALQSMKTMHIYPDPESRRIRRRLADFHQISEDNIVLGAGADELIDLIMRLVIEPGDSLVNCPPTFGMYAFDGTLNQARVINVSRNINFSINISEIIKAVKANLPKIIFLANPNNPDGNMISQKEFFELLNLPVLLVMDEAYINFIDGDQHTTLREVEKHKNLIVLRTFSKWAGLAGLRIGYGIFPTWIVPLLMKAKQPYNVSVAAEEAALIALDNIKILDQNVTRIIQERNRLFSELSKISWLEPYPSQANFILCKVKELEAAQLKQWLRKQGILIRYFDKPGLSDHIRISVGTQEQNDRILRALKGVK
jgi:histidinol-phosphate aminotransferase